jgi:ferrous iron transport protein A
MDGSSVAHAEFLDTPDARPREAEVVAPLSRFSKGDRGVIVRVGVGRDGRSALPDGELERRLLELGFVEGARVELLHEGLFGRDPIAVRLDDMRVALRRREAANVFVQRLGGRR